MLTCSFGLEKQALTVNTREGMAEGGDGCPEGAASWSKAVALAELPTLTPKKHRKTQDPQGARGRGLTPTQARGYRLCGDTRYGQRQPGATANKPAVACHTQPPASYDPVDPSEAPSVQMSGKRPWSPSGSPALPPCGCPSTDTGNTTSAGLSCCSRMDSS